MTETLFDTCIDNPSETLVKVDEETLSIDERCIGKKYGDVYENPEPIEATAT